MVEMWTNVQGKLSISSLLARAFGKSIGWSVNMEDLKLAKEFVGLATKGVQK